MAKERKDGNGHSFWAKEKSMWYMARCHKCGRENYAPAVATGKCAWCGYDVNKETKDG